ncbi:SH3 domain-containing protein [Chloroflexi bacterium TSY]|nr:SH3 domain-containing protein [Chloroflexi bacterium TSY]
MNHPIRIYENNINRMLSTRIRLLGMALFTISMTLLTACRPFEVSAVVEPNTSASNTNGAFDVSIDIEPDVVQALDAVAASALNPLEGEPEQESTRQATLAVASSSGSVASTTNPPLEPTIVQAVLTPSFPSLTTLVTLNVRTGPATEYARVGGILPGKTVQVVGRNAQATWWQIVWPRGSAQRAWVSANASYGTAHNVTGLSVVAVPPVPEPQPVQQPRLVYHSNRYGENSLFLHELQSNQLRQLSGGIRVDDSLVAASPDGSKLAFVSDRSGNPEIFVMELDESGQYGRSLRRLTATAGKELWPSWSPGGKQIAFDSDRDGNREIYIMDADGRNIIRVTHHNAEDGGPSWSPDGRRLVFHSDRDGNHEIYTMNVDGSDVRRLTNHPANEWAPAWSPDGTQIAFMSYRDGSAEIYVMDAQGGNLGNLTNHPAEDAVPVWSPDGKQIAFESQRDGNLEIYVMNATGGELKRVTYSSANDGRPAWLVNGADTSR